MVSKKKTSVKVAKKSKAKKISAGKKPRKKVGAKKKRSNIDVDIENKATEIQLQNPRISSVKAKSLAKTILGAPGAKKAAPKKAAPKKAAPKRNPPKLSKTELDSLLTPGKTGAVVKGNGRNAQVVHVWGCYGPKRTGCGGGKKGGHVINRVR
jgi:hypothetical protein